MPSFDRWELIEPSLEYNTRVLLAVKQEVLESNRIGKKGGIYTLKIKKKGNIFVEGQRKRPHTHTHTHTQNIR